jgi:hypothetical protein
MSDSNSKNGPGTKLPSDLPPLTRIHLDLIDIVFGVIVGVSFTDFRDILVPISVKFETFTLLLAYVTVIGSWIGYHRAINKKPDESAVRFIIDLIILYLYFYLIYSITDFFTVLAILPLIFGLYTIWAVTRDLAFKKRGEIVRRGVIYDSTLGKSSSKKNTIFFILFLAQFLIYLFFGNSFQQPVILAAPLFNWLLLISGITMLVIYRSIK